jgi:NAD-dependent dihydropyrimidine dehydrogenase PreA subunit
MHPSPTYRALAEKVIKTEKWQEVAVPDSLYPLLAHMYTDEEAEIVLTLHEGGMKTPKSVAKKVRRPVEEVKPILESLAERILILGVGPKGVAVYGPLALYPFIYDAQMLRCDKEMREGTVDETWFREYVRLSQAFMDEFYDWLAPRDVAKKYQIMGMPFGRVIAVEQAIDSTPGLGIVALDSDIYSETVERAKKSLALVSTCTCRLGKHLMGEGCGRLRNTCSTMGLPAEGAIKSGMGRRVSKEEFLDAKLKASEAGLVHMTENVLDPMLVCSCCSCCCEILGILNKFESPATFTKSHFEATVIPEKCTACKQCVDMCPMGAITMVKRPGTYGKKAPARKKTAKKKVATRKAATKKKTATRKATPKMAVIDYKRCIGCGVCVTKCDKFEAIVLQERKIFRPPADNMAEAFARRYFELKGQQDNLVPKLTLGVTRFLSSVNPIHITGPRAMTFKKN